MIELRKCQKYEWAWCDGNCDHCQVVCTTGIVPPYIQDQMMDSDEIKEVQENGN